MPFYNFTQNFPDIVARLVILILSSMALGAVIIMVRLRIKGLRDKASNVFMYLLALDSIKIPKENLKITLQDIERYLNDNDWTLAGYWVKRLLLEYRDLFYAEANKD